MLEQLEECPSSGDEISPKKRKYVIDHSSTVGGHHNYHLLEHHHNNSSTSSAAAAAANNPVTNASSSASLLQQSAVTNLLVQSDLPMMNNDGSHKTIELRRLSEASLKQHTAAHMHNSTNHHHSSSATSRRPSTDSLQRHNSTSSSIIDHSTYNSLLKRRKTSLNEPPTGPTGGGGEHHLSSGRGSRLHSVHSHEASGGESADGSRPGTPLCDEPSEPRRVPRERSHEPMYLPLPKFAEQMFRSRMSSLTPAQSAMFHVSCLPPSVVAAAVATNASTLSSLTNHHNSTNSVAGIMASPPPPLLSSGSSSSLNSRLSTVSLLQPTETIPSSPARPPSLSSNTSDSEAENANPALGDSIKERLKSFEERFEKWAEGSVHRRNSEQFQSSFRSKFLDLDVKEQSDIAKYMLEKKSIFDEDSKRLENIGDKYEPREFTNYQPRIPVAVPLVTTASVIPMQAKPSTPTTSAAPSNPNLNQLHQQRLGSGSPCMNSPPYQSPNSGNSTPVIKPLQYPFPSHPPTTAAAAAATPTKSSSVVAQPATSPPQQQTSTAVPPTNCLEPGAKPKIAPPPPSQTSCKNSTNPPIPQPRVLTKSASMPVGSEKIEDENKTHKDRRKSTVENDSANQQKNEEQER